MKQFHVLIILSVPAFFTTVFCRLPCQTALPDKGSQTSRNESRPRPRPAPPNPGKARPNLCCDTRPFNSGLKMCCMGRLIPVFEKRCCLSGNPVPRGANCACDPKSDWIKNQTEHLHTLETRFRTLLEIMEDAKRKIIDHINDKEVLIEELDAAATSLYRSFLNVIDVARNQDPEEVQYIYDLVTFLHSNEEEDSEGYINEDKVSEGEIGHMLNDAGFLNEEDKPEERIKKFIPGNKGLVRRLLGEIQIGPDRLKKALVPLVKRQLEENIESANEEEVERLILERNSIVSQITRENEDLIAIKERLEVLEEIIQWFLIDAQLIAILRELLEKFLEEALEAEDAHEQSALDQEMEEFHEGSFDFRLTRKRREAESSMSGLVESTTNIKCDVSRWTNYIENFTRRAEAANSDLKVFLSPTSQLVTANRKGNDPVPQSGSLLVIRLGESRYNMEEFRLTRLSKLFNLGKNTGKGETGT